MKFDIKLQKRDFESKRTIFKSAGVLANYVNRDYWDPPKKRLLGSLQNKYDQI